jgi:hypothetical protein
MTPEQLKARVDNSKVKDKFEQYAALERSVVADNQESENYFIKISKVAEKYNISLGHGDLDWPEKIYKLLSLLEGRLLPIQYFLVAYDSEDKLVWSLPVLDKVFRIIKESANDFDEYGDCFPLDYEDCVTLQRELGLVLPFNQIEDRTSIILDKLLERRRPLIEHRNELVERPFFLFRKSLKEKVVLLDKEIEEIDLELNKQRRIYASSGVRWYLERGRDSMNI